MVVALKLGLGACFGKFWRGHYDVNKEEKHAKLLDERREEIEQNVSAESTKAHQGMDNLDPGTRPKAFSTTDLYSGPRHSVDIPRSHGSTPSESPHLRDVDSADGVVPYKRLQEGKPRAMSQPIADYFTKRWHAQHKGKTIEEMLKEPRIDTDEVSGHPQHRIRLKVIKIESSV